MREYFKIQLISSVQNDINCIKEEINRIEKNINGVYKGNQIESENLRLLQEKKNHLELQLSQI